MRSGKMNTPTYLVTRKAHDITIVFFEYFVMGWTGCRSSWIQMCYRRLKIDFYVFIVWSALGIFNDIWIYNNTSFNEYWSTCNWLKHEPNLWKKYDVWSKLLNVDCWLCRKIFFIGCCVFLLVWCTIRSVRNVGLKLKV